MKNASAVGGTTCEIITAANRLKGMLPPVTAYRNSTREIHNLHEYITYMKQQGQGHSNRGILTCPLKNVGCLCPLLLGTPDCLVHDPDSTQPIGLLEIKNPYSVREMTIPEAVEKPSFYLEKKENNIYKLKDTITIIKFSANYIVRTGSLLSVPKKTCETCETLCGGTLTLINYISLACPLRHHTGDTGDTGASFLYFFFV